VQRLVGMLARSSLTRRQLGVLALTLFLGLSGLGPLQPSSVAAGDDFCAGDPIIAVDGKQVNLVVGVPYSKLNGNPISASNPVRLTVLVPSNVNAKVVKTEAWERVTILPALPPAAGQTTQIQFTVIAPAPSGNPAYDVYFQAISSVDSRSAWGKSGPAFGTSLLVARG
jgi:hypothetical protein